MIFLPRNKKHFLPIKIKIHSADSEAKLKLYFKHQFMFKQQKTVAQDRISHYFAISAVKYIFYVFIILLQGRCFVY